MPSKWIYQTFADPKLLTPEAMAWLTTFVPKEQAVVSNLLSWYDINVMAAAPDQERRQYLDDCIKIYYA
jgi:hypothetical protein